MPVRGWKRHIDYPTFAEWQIEKIGWAASCGWLPDAGLVACDGSGIAAMGFVHADPSSTLSQLVFLANRPGDSSQVGRDALATVIRSCALLSKFGGHEILFTVCCNDGVAELTQSLGWARTPGHAVQLAVALETL